MEIIEMRRSFIIFMMIFPILLLSACGKESHVAKDGVTTYYFGKEENINLLSELSEQINAEEIYSSLEYNEKMLYGEYWLNNQEKEFDSFVKESQYVEIEYCKNFGTQKVPEKAMVSQLPYKILAGPANLKLARTDRTQEWAELYFATEDGGTLTVLCTYSVEGNKVTYTPLDYYEVLYDEEHKQIGTQYTVGEDGMEYSFSFKGPQITLSQGENDVTLYAFNFSENTSLKGSIGGYLSLETAKIDNMESFLGAIYDDSATLYITEENDVLNANGIFMLADDGIATLHWCTKEEEGNEERHLKQFVYFICGQQAMIFADKEDVYYYTESSISRETMLLGEGMTTEEVTTLNELSESVIAQIVQKKENLLLDLTNAFEQAGIRVEVDAESGEMAVDASVLFGGDSAVVTDEGKALLKEFLGIYTSIVFNEKYAGFVSRTLIEGHTALLSNSTYESGLPLSEERANNVKAYCLSNDAGIDEKYMAEFIDTLEAIGCSNSKPVYDAEGNVDTAASRRVSFRFIVNLE